ncbi:MAG: hypothetical protein EBZ36_07565 [Acidobacteria bacterium]|nr:hypothetical protein [Acidobacteriota bacterium]
MRRGVGEGVVEDPGEVGGGGQNRSKICRHDRVPRRRVVELVVLNHERTPARRVPIEPDRDAGDVAIERPHITGHIKHVASDLDVAPNDGVVVVEVDAPAVIAGSHTLIGKPLEERVGHGDR